MPQSTLGKFNNSLVTSENLTLNFMVIVLWSSDIFLLLSLKLCSLFIPFHSLDTKIRRFNSSPLCMNQGILCVRAAVMKSAANQREMTDQDPCLVDN